MVAKCASDMADIIIHTRKQREKGMPAMHRKSQIKIMQSCNLRTQIA
jgi:hypothetical protein